MTTVLGLNKGRTAFGKVLRDGGGALIREGRLLGAIAEERLSRKKYDGGSTLAAGTLLEYFDIKPSEIDTVVVSTCCEPEDVGEFRTLFSESEVISCNHHLSHGYGSFIPSQYDRAIVAIFDGGGNVGLSDSKNDWWECPRDQQTYFLGNGQELEVVGRDFAGSSEAGIGEVYRAFTYFLGWNSSRRAGNVMSLAAYGDPNFLAKESLLWLDGNGQMQSAMKCAPLEPLEMVASLLARLGHEIPPRRAGEPITQVHCNVAAWLQEEVENALLGKIRLLVKQIGVRNVCIGGGVAYNCRAVGRIMRANIAEQVYVGPAAGDQGQCIGNAIYGTIRSNVPIRIGRLSPYLGLPSQTDTRGIVDAVAKLGPDFAAIQPNDCIRVVAERLAAGAIGAVFQGRSEFGLRALGNRSIVALPNAKSVQWRLNIVKNRDLFMPFAPVISAESAHRYVVSVEDLPYMTAAVETTELLQKIAPAVVHVDNTARIQTVREDQCGHLYHLLRNVEALTGHPVLLNTSFNQGGKPIVESVTDALEAFVELDLDFLWINDVLVERGRCPNALQGADKIERIEAKGKLFHDVSLNKLIESPSTYNLPSEVATRDLFMLFGDYVELVRTGRKVTTIRYRKGAIDLPRRAILPLYASANFLRDASTEYVGVVWISSFKVLPFGNLDDVDAVRDGFADLSELTEALTTIYGQIAPGELVTVYSINQTSSFITPSDRRH